MNELQKMNDIERIVMGGDLSQLNPEQRVQYVAKICESIGLNPLTRPFQYITLQGKLTLYASKGCTDQLRSVRGISLTIRSQKSENDVYVVSVLAKDKDGREDEDVGAVNIAGLKGDALANAIMKAITKAKRRVTLSICGLGLLDESELETIPNVKKEKEIEQPTKKLSPIIQPEEFQTSVLHTDKYNSHIVYSEPEEFEDKPITAKDVLVTAKLTGWNVQNLSAIIEMVFNKKSSNDLTQEQLKELHELVKKKSYQQACDDWVKAAGTLNL